MNLFTFMFYVCWFKQIHVSYRRGKSITLSMYFWLVSIGKWSVTGTKTQRLLDWPVSPISIYSK
jgi:hypothetical protein